MPPAVSVLLPVRDAAATLPAALASLLTQTFADFEIVAVDDGSTDTTAAILAATADPRLRVLRRPRRGLVPALGHGLAACTAPLVARMDGDDVAHPERLAAQVALLAARPEVGVASCFVEGTGAAGMARYIAWQNQLITPAQIARARFIESPVVHPTVMARREVLLAAGGYRDGAFPEDYDLWLRLLGAGVRFAKVPRVLLSWRDHGARATRTDPRYGEDALRALKLRHLLEGPLRARPPVVFWGAGLEGKPLVRALVHAGVRPVALLDLHRRKLGQVIHGVRVRQVSDLPHGLHAHPAAVLLAAVGVPEARPEIRDGATWCGLTEGERFFFLR